MTGRARAAAALTVLFVAAGAACVDLNVAPNGPVVWQATLTATPAYPGVTGQAAAVSQATGTTVGVGVDGATSGAQMAWGLSLGTCASPQQGIGDLADYPALAVDTAGKASSQTLLGNQLGAGGQYFVDVRVSVADSTRVACGDLKLQ